ncbi:MAG: hypothetical protein FJ308_18460 [Planctomycetes bacterium]|nr:hypothetical protein [Planctomycetota bacterium]
MKIRPWAIIALAVIAAVATLWSKSIRATADDLPPRHSRRVIPTQWGDREFILHVPTSHDPTTPLPLVIMLHGFGGSGLNAAKETGWSDKADQESFIVAYPEATRPDKSIPQSFRKNPQAWNDGSARFHAVDQNVDDVSFIAAMIELIREKHAIDSRRIFVTGFSNGASMAFRVGAELSQHVAAIAPVAGTCWLKKPLPSNPISICYITGTADSLNPILGGFPKLAMGGKEQGGQPKPPVQEYIDVWRDILDCQAKPTIDEISDGVHKTVYGHGRLGSEILVLTVDGLGHHWPGGVSQAPHFLVGKSSNKLIATDVVWDFFQSHAGSER